MSGAPYAIPLYDPSAGPSTSLPFLGVTDATSLIVAIAQLNATGAGGTIVAAPGTYTLPPGAGPIVTSSHINILGSGQQSSTIVFDPTANDQAAIKFLSANPANPIAQCSISGFGFRSADTTFRKIMIDIVDGESIHVSRIASAEGLWTGNVSEGVRFRGRQMLFMRECTIAADNPLRIMQNPILPGIDFDHCHVQDCYFIANNAPNIKADSNAVLTNPTIEGQAWNKGSDGMVWNPTGVGGSIAIDCRNIRWEQQQSVNGHFFDIGAVSGSAITKFGITNAFGGLTSKGIKVRTVGVLELDRFEYVGTSVALDLDGTVQDTICAGSSFGSSGAGATASLASQSYIEGDPVNNSASSPLPPTFRLRSTSVNSGGLTLWGGAKMRTFTGQLANGGTFDLWANNLFTGAEKAAIIFVALQNNATGASVAAGIICAAGTAGGGNTCPTPSATFDAGNVGGKFTVLWQSSVSNILLNQLGFTANYTVTMLWN